MHIQKAWLFSQERGFPRGITAVKSDIVAPRVDITITSAAPGGGYNTQTGTSMATPFCNGKSCLNDAVGNREWG